MTVTRSNFANNWAVRNARMTSHNGTVRFTVQRGIPQTWATSRPVYSPESEGSPGYLTVPPANAPTSNRLIFGGVSKFQPAQPNLEMDPSNPTTWQRPYRMS